MFGAMLFLTGFMAFHAVLGAAALRHNRRYDALHAPKDSDTDRWEDDGGMAVAS